jgi:hypothetical protein
MLTFRILPQTLSCIETELGVSRSDIIAAALRWRKDEARVPRSRLRDREEDKAERFQDASVICHVCQMHMDSALRHSTRERQGQPDLTYMAL